MGASTAKLKTFLRVALESTSPYHRSCTARASAEKCPDKLRGTRPPRSEMTRANTKEVAE